MAITIEEFVKARTELKKIVPPKKKEVSEERFNKSRRKLKRMTKKKEPKKKKAPKKEPKTRERKKPSWAKEKAPKPITEQEFRQQFSNMSFLMR